MEIAAAVFKYIGLLFICIGTLGAILQKDIFVKLHFTSVSDTVGVILLIVGFAFNYPQHLNYWILFIVLIAFIGPISSIAIAKGYFEKNRRK